jgi:cytochrome c2
MNTILGIIFLLSGTAATFLMYHLWGYPYDKEKHESAAPQSLVFVHRLLGYTYIGIYIYLMVQMVPRMWTYQIELPARTVVHLTCGILIGAILIIKLMIVRFFRHLEGTLIPALGTGLLLLTVVIISLSVPFAIRESMLNRQALSGGMGLQHNLTRVSKHLTDIGLTDEALKSQLTRAEGLILGRKVLNNKCVVCHDLRTVLSRPQTAKQWRQTVNSMASRSDIFTPITAEEQWQVTAYLIAITPDLQRSLEQQATISQDRSKAAAAIKTAIKKSATPNRTGDDQAAAQTDDEATSSATPDTTAKANPTDPEQLAATPSPPPTHEADATSIPPSSANVSNVAAVSLAPAGYSTEQAKMLFEIRCTDCHNASKVEENPPADLADVQALVQKMVGKGMEGTREEFEILIHYLFETYVNKKS